VTPLSNLRRFPPEHAVKSVVPVDWEKKAAPKKLSDVFLPQQNAAMQTHGVQSLQMKSSSLQHSERASPGR
jgi:hypothetical protein